jgi:hypothetical protein
MISKFHNSDFPIKIDTCDLNLPATEFISKRRIEAIVAVELLCDLLLPVSLIGMRACCDFDRLSLTNKGAAKFADQQCLCIWSTLFMLRILNSQNVPCILYQSMLKASSRSNERPFLFTSELDSPKRSIHALVRTSRRTPECVKLLQCCPNRPFC